jgi:uncharacterized damage-inducible protein DinB
MKAHFDTFAQYNAWANRRLYDAAADLSDADYRADRGAFFKSMHGTLNHLLVTDRIWMQRITGQGDAPDRLDAILFDDLVATPEMFEQPLAPALAHLFNHQTHHRGQAHMILTSLGRKAPELDLLYFQRIVTAGTA